MQNLINWVLANPFYIVISVGFIYLIVRIVINTAMTLDESPVDYDSDDSIKQRNNMNMYAGCLGHCAVIYEYTPGIPTISSHPIRFGEIVLINVKVVYGLQSSADILPLLTPHQKDLLSFNVYKEHEARAMLQVKTSY